VGFGSPKEVADELIAWVEETDVDGFNLAYTATPETFPDFVDLVVPELQKRGRYKLDYAVGTLPKSSTVQVARGSARIIQRRGSAGLPIGPAADSGSERAAAATDRSRIRTLGPT
jgi:hypothetical protein